METIKKLDELMKGIIDLSVEFEKGMKEIVDNKNIGMPGHSEIEKSIFLTIVMNPIFGKRFVNNVQYLACFSQLVDILSEKDPEKRLLLVMKEVQRMYDELQKLQ